MIVVGDDSVVSTSNLVAGANKTGWRMRNTNYGRDFVADVVGNIAFAKEGDISIVNGDKLKLARGVEVGNIFQLEMTRDSSGRFQSRRITSRCFHYVGKKKISGRRKSSISGC